MSTHTLTLTYQHRKIAPLSAQCRQVYCLVQRAPSVPSWRPPRHRSDFNDFPGRREWPNQCSQYRSFQAFSTYPTLRRTHRGRITPSDPSLNQPRRKSQALAACPERPYSSRTFTNLTNSLNLEPKEWKNNLKSIDTSSSIGSKLRWIIMNWIAWIRTFEMRNENGPLCVVIATDQTKPFNTELSPRKVFRSNHRRRVAPSDPSMIKLSGQKVARLEKPKRNKTSINPNICLNLEPKGWQYITKCPVIHWNPQ